MPGMLTVDVRSTFASMLVMSISEKMKFGTEVPEVNAAGERKYTVDLAVTYCTDPGMRPACEVITATITGGDHNAILSIPPGTQVTLDRLRCGVSAPEKRDDGRVRGGRLWFSAGSIHPVRQQADKAA
jgi:hypothetical protein